MGIRISSGVLWSYRASNSSMSFRKRKDTTSMTLAEWAATWGEQYLKRTVTVRSYERQLSIVNRQIVPALGAIPLQKLSTVRINEFYRNLESSGLGAATVRYAHIVLGSCLKAAAKIGALARNPVANASPPRGKSESGPAVSGGRAGGRNRRPH